MSVGSVYRVATVRELRWNNRCSHDDCGTVTVELFGLRRYDLPGELACFCPNRFRPIYRPRADLLASLMQPAPELERV